MVNSVWTYCALFPPRRAGRAFPIGQSWKPCWHGIAGKWMAKSVWNCCDFISPSQMLPMLPTFEMARDMAIEELEHYRAGRSWTCWNWRDQMTYPQLMDVLLPKSIFKAESWRQYLPGNRLFENRRMDNFGLVWICTTFLNLCWRGLLTSPT